MNHSTKKAEKLIKKLHNEIREQGKPIKYPPKEGEESTARAAWPMTGVCPSCWNRSITVGRCIMCGWDSNTRTITNAPESYDGFGTVTEDVLGKDKKGQIFRRVSTPPEHLEWQRMRYSSGLFYALDELKWVDLKDLILVQEAS